MNYSDEPRTKKDDREWVPMKEETEGKKLLNSIAGIVGVLGLGFGACLFFSFLTLIVLTLGRLCGCTPE
jgi:hypothetical protein